MKKTLLLSVVASTMIMAGGDIVPVEPVIEPVVETSGWDFSGQAVLYYQTADAAGTLDLFEQNSAKANAGIKLRATNKDLAYGIGAGVEVNGLGTLGLQEDAVLTPMQGSNGWISQAYLTYAFGNTSMKFGRQELPKALSPFAYSEGWNVFKNSFDAALLVNSDIADTTLVGAVVFKANSSVAPTAFNAINSEDGKGSTSNALLGTDDPVFMLTAQNKSIDGLTLTGSFYYTADMELATTEDLMIGWADAQFKISDYAVAVQGGTIMSDALADDALAYGAKASANFGMFGAMVAFTSTDENAPFTNTGGVKTPLYTQMVANQGVIAQDADYVKAGVSAKALGGKFAVNYGYAVANDDDIAGGADNNPYELDVLYTTKVFNDSTDVLAAYVLTDPDTTADSTNIIRVWGRYNF